MKRTKKQILDAMDEQMPFDLNPRLEPYLMEAMEIYKNQSEWVIAEDENPICYESGDWDGKRSDFVLTEDSEGNYRVARMYEGFMDGSDFANWYDNDDNDLDQYTIVRWMNIDMYN